MSLHLVSVMHRELCPSGIKALLVRFCSGQQNQKGQTCVIALMVILKDFQSRG